MTMQGTPAGNHSDPHGCTTSPQTGALLQLIQRIDSMLDEEANLMAGSPPEDFDRLIARKNYLALETARFASNIGPFSPDASLRLKLQQAKARLDENAKVLQRNIDAVGDILTLMSDVVNRAQSDGTYTYETMKQGARK